MQIESGPNDLSQHLLICLSIFNYSFVQSNPTCCLLFSQHCPTIKSFIKIHYCNAKKKNIVLYLKSNTLVKLILPVGDSRNGCQHFKSISICFNWVNNYFSTTNQFPCYNCNYQIMERGFKNFGKQDLVKILLQKNL